MLIIDMDEKDLEKLVLKGLELEFIEKAAERKALTRKSDIAVVNTAFWGYISSSIYFKSINKSVL